MRRRKVLYLTVGSLIALGVSSASLGLPQAAHAGGVQLSIGIGIPLPVYIAPPPAVVYSPPVIVQPSPGIIYPPPVAYQVPYGVYGHPKSRGYGRKPEYHRSRHGHHPAHGYHSYKHGKRRW